MEKSKAFVIMPFEEDFFDSYNMIADYFKEDYLFSNAANEDNQQNILADIVKPIIEADVILADLSGLNPNVMYELGVAHSFNKKTIVITRDDLAKLPFDLKQYRTKSYSTHFKDFNDLLKYLDKNIRGAIEGSVVFNNPVSDFLDANQIERENIVSTATISIPVPDTEKGLLDFIDEIENDINNMNNHIDSIGTDLEAMNKGVENCNREINRMKQNGSTNGTASFVRKQARKVAEHIEVFNEKFAFNREKMFESWQKIETNTYGLLDNKYFISHDNNSSEEYIKGLHTIKESIVESDESIIVMKNALDGVTGIEKNLTQSINTLTKDLETYLDMTSQIVSSIDRITKKYRSFSLKD